LFLILPYFQPKTPTVISLKDANFLPVEDKEKKFVVLIETMAKTYNIAFEVTLCPEF
jgi:hypothetical protein